MEEKSKRQLAIIVNEFSKTAGSLNGFKHIPQESLFDRILGPNAWYKAEFEGEGIESQIWSWENSFSVDGFKDNIEIKYNSQRVYFANTNRSDSRIHINQVFDNNGEWLQKIMELTERYSSQN